MTINQTSTGVTPPGLRLFLATMYACYHVCLIRCNMTDRAPHPIGNYFRIAISANNLDKRIVNYYNRTATVVLRWD